MPAAAAVDDPYDGIVPNPNRKRNPMVLVGELEKKQTEIKRRGVEAARFFDEGFTIFPFFPTHPGAAATGGVLATGLIAFRKARNKKGWRWQGEGEASSFLAHPLSFTSLSLRATSASPSP